MRKERKRKRMELPNFICSVLSSKKKEELIINRKVRVIKEFIRKREELKIAKENELTQFKQLCRKRSIDEERYHRLKQLMILTYEQKRIDLLNATMEKSVILDKSVSSCNNQQRNIIKY